MFELIEEVDEVQLAISLPGLESVSSGKFIPFDRLVGDALQESYFDALFTGGFSKDYGEEKSRELLRICAEKRIELVVFENPANDLAVIQDVVLNIADKLFSNEHPNNLGIADIRNLNLYSDHLYAFNSKQSALDFLQTLGLVNVVGGVFLAHENTSLSEYEATGNELLRYFNEEGFLCSSIHSSGRGECTILLGIEKQKVYCAEDR